VDPKRCLATHANGRAVSSQHFANPPLPTVPLGRQANRLPAHRYLPIGRLMSGAFFQVAEDKMGPFPMGASVSKGSFQTGVSRFRPFFLLLARSLLPPEVLERCRKPCLLLRLLLEG
jgi:hypothetical protein